jgi:formate dehydrogenase major subunit
VLHTARFGDGERATLRCIDFHPSPEQMTDAFPLLLTTGRSLYHFNAGTMTGRTRNVELRPADFVDIAPADATRAGLQDGDPVRVVSRYGVAVLPSRISAALAEGVVFATFHTREVFLNAVTGPYRDGVVGSPEYKVTAVRIEPVATT